MKKKLAHIVYSGFGGTTDYILNLVRGDVNREFDHAIIFYGVEATSEDTLSYAHETAGEVELIVKRRGRDRRALEHLWQLLRRMQPEAVTLHVNSLIPETRKWLPGGARLIFVEHQAHHLKTRKEWIYSIIAQRRAAHIVSLTPESQLGLRKKLRFLYRPSRNRVITTGICTDDYHCNPKGDRIKIGMIGRLNPLRDHETLIRAYLQLPEDTAELHLAGDGPLLAGLQEKYGSDRVIFHGLLNRQEIIHFLSELDIYVQASFGETSSIALMQAQASKLPIIASDVAGITNAFDTSCAILVPPGNVNPMTAALLHLVKDASLRSELAAKGYEKVKDHNAMQMFNCYKLLLP